MSDNEYCIVITTTDDENNAEKIAAHLVNNKLARCVQIDEIKSYYHWQAQLQVDNEYRLLVKTPSNNYVAIEKAILEIHNYDLPQIIKLDITGGHESYLKWLGGWQE